MGYSSRFWICRSCNRESEIGVAPGSMEVCEQCGGAASSRPSLEVRGGEPGVGAFVPRDEESWKRGVVARLRDGYAKARELVPAAASDGPSHEHLDWILGARRNPDRDDAAFDAEVSQLVVLWLEDLVLELDDCADSGDLGPADSRHAVANGLRVASRDFAEAFLGFPTP